MAKEYYLILWPESQEYQERRGVHGCADINGAVFVPKGMIDDGEHNHK